MTSPEPIFSATCVLQQRAKLSGAGGTSGPIPVAAKLPRFMMTSTQAAVWSYHWLLWLFLIGLLFAQLSCIFWDSSTHYESTTIGRAPSDGPRTLEANDVDPEPLADRMVVCALNGGRQYQPMQLSAALARNSSNDKESANSINAYRVVRRRQHEVGVSSESLAELASVCDLIAWTVDAIAASCTSLGYNVTNDYIRVVDGLHDAAEIRGITDSLPVLIESIADLKKSMRFIMPSHDGSACVFRLFGKYETPTSTLPLTMRAVPRAVYEKKTLEFLKLENQTSGAWRNGWYTAQDGTKWHSEVISTVSAATSDDYGMFSRIFDTEHNRELSTNATTSWPVGHTWGSVASTTDTLLWFHSATISNGANVGIYRYESSEFHVLRSQYTLETLLTNASVFWVLLRWAVCMVGLQRSFSRGSAVAWHAASLGDSVACLRSFHFLPIVLLVRLKATLAAFWTAGCAFSGDQRAVAEAWFVVYPAIAELVFFNFSALNMVAKMLRRRVSDALFGPTLAFFCVLHLIREFVFPERIPMVVSSAELNSLSLSSLLLVRVALRLNGNVAWLFHLKIAVLVLNWLPLFCFVERNSAVFKRSHAPQGCRVEKALALRVSNLGGFGRSCAYINDLVESTATEAFESTPLRRTAVAPFELLRMGYVVLGCDFVVSINDWFLLVALTPWRRRPFPPNFRIVVFTLERESKQPHAAATIACHPELMRLNDPRLVAIDMVDLSTSIML